MCYEKYILLKTASWNLRIICGNEQSKEGKKKLTVRVP